MIKKYNEYLNINEAKMMESMLITTVSFVMVNNEIRDNEIIFLKKGATIPHSNFHDYLSTIMMESNFDNSIYVCYCNINDESILNGLQEDTIINIKNNSELKEYILENKITDD